MRLIKEYGKRALTLLLALIMIFSDLSPVLSVFAANEIPFADMEPGVRYTAKFNYGDAYLRNKDGELYSIGGYQTTVDITNISLPLIVMLENKGDVYVRIMNEDWPAAYEEYRYVDEIDVTVLERLDPVEPEPDNGMISGQVGLVVDGQKVETLSIASGEKTTVFTNLSSNVTDASAYRWQLLIDEENDRWANITDYVYPYASVSEALIANAGLNGAATLRCIVVAGDKQYVSDELRICVDAAAPTPEPVVAAKTRKAPGLMMMSRSTRAADDPNEAFQVTVQYIYWNNSPLSTSGHGETAMPTFTATVSQSLPLTSSVPSLPIAGYKAYIRDDSRTDGRPYTAKEDPGNPNSSEETHYYVEAPTVDFYQQTSAKSVTVYYLPIEVSVTVNHYIQELDSDEYTLHDTDNLTGFSAHPVGEGLQLDLEGFSNLFYDPNVPISANGNTTVNIYYDRNYYLIDFDLSGANDSEGYGVMPLYVRYGTTVQVGKPENPGYAFDAWELLNVYLKEETVDDNGEIQTTITEINDTNIRNEYADPSKALVIKHNLKYKATWTVATAAYTVIYWRENADSTDASNKSNYSVWATETKTSIVSGTVIDCTTIDIPQSLATATIDGKSTNEKPYFTRANAMSDQIAVVKGDNSTVVNIYYTRNTYHLWFYNISGKCALYEHTHGDGTCDGKMFCAQEEHSHMDSCEKVLTCTIEEHKQHTGGDGGCCTVSAAGHTHTKSCYGITGDAVNAGSSAPKTPKNGQIYYRNSNRQKYIYFGGSWYSYTGNANSGSVIDPFSGDCPAIHIESNHSTGNCTCAKPLHTHIDDCYTYSCGKIAHTHNQTDCYSDCTRYEHTHTSTCNSNNTSNNIWVISAKYGADISAVWPTAELIQREINSTFKLLTWSQFANTSAALATKRITMTADLCVDSTTPPRSSANSTNSNTQYTIFYMFESFDQTSPASGNNRHNYNNSGKFYDSDGRYEQKLYSTNSLSAKQISGMVPVTNSSTSGSNNTMFLYYNRNRHEIIFENVGAQVHTMADIMFEQPLNAAFFNNRMASYSGKKELWDFVDANGNTVQVAIPIPNTPSTYEEGSVVFAGWYTTPLCVDGTEFNFANAATMPDANVTLFAKWEPTYWDVVVYQEKPTASNPNPTVLWEHYDIPFGTLPNTLEKEPTRVSPVKGYIFAGWYYEDENGQEKRFDFNTMPIKHDYVIYAKWTSEVPVDYIVYYKTYKDGAWVDIAAPSKGQSLAGVAKSFMAKAGNDLYAGYRTGYFPTAREQTQMMEHTQENGGLNEIIFEYVFSEKVDYQIKHVFVTDNLESIIGTDTLTLIWTGSITASSSAELKENFKDEIKEQNVKSKLKGAGYNYSQTTVDKIWNVLIHMSPDDFNQTLTLVANVPAEENEIVFYWSEHYDMTVYEVRHVYTAPNGEEYLLRKETFDGRYIAGTDNTVALPSVITVKGYEYSGSYTTNNKNLLNLMLPTPTQDGLVITMHYNREEYQYTVRFKDTDGFLISHSQKVEGTGYYLDELTVGTLVKDVYIPGYTLVNGSDKVVLEYDGQIIDVIYQKETASYYYMTISGIGNCTPMYEPDVRFGESPEGSQATPGRGWLLEGWYYSENSDASNLRSVSTVGATVSEDGTLIPRAPTTEDVGKTFYFWAKFVPTSLTISSTINAGPANAWVTDNQGFVYKITGTANTATAGVTMVVAIPEGQSVTIHCLPIGDYTITMVNDWSWRYDAELKTITLEDEETVDFVYDFPDADSTNGKYYITDEAYKYS